MGIKEHVALIITCWASAVFAIVAYVVSSSHIEAGIEKTLFTVAVGFLVFSMLLTPFLPNEPKKGRR